MPVITTSKTLHRFDSALTNKDQAMPRFELNTPTSGVISPKLGDDVIGSLRAKEIRRRACLDYAEVKVTCYMLVVLPFRGMLKELLVPTFKQW